MAWKCFEEFANEVGLLCQVVFSRAGLTSVVAMFGCMMEIGAMGVFRVLQHHFKRVTKGVFHAQGLVENIGDGSPGFCVNRLVAL
jgi:hypothetical protein